MIIWSDRSGYLFVVSLCLKVMRFFLNMLNWIYNEQYWKGIFYDYFLYYYLQLVDELWCCFVNLWFEYCIM